ncbi:MAG: glycoside hydrolase family 95 protein [Tannerella sp.]|nr:glycoside hydrolase family 95 protein [Tannerella sp.]
MKKKVPERATFTCILVAIIALSATFNDITAQKQDIIPQVLKPYRLWYTEAAPDSDWGWLDQSFPMGNGYMGVNLFGGVGSERIQITENSTQDSNNKVGGLNNFAEVYIDFAHDNATSGDYMRELLLDEGIARIRYSNGGVTYQRDYFTSYPDAVMAVRLTADRNGMINFTLRPTIPYLCDYREKAGDNRGKSGMVVASGDIITLSGVMEFYNVQFEGQFKVIPTGGKLIANTNGTITVTGADEAVILIAVGTNYVIADSKAMSQSDRLQKLAGNPHSHAKVTKYITDAAAKSYDELLKRHRNDYKSLYDRMSFDLGGIEPEIPTNILIDNYRNNSDNADAPYLEELITQYGRYLLICSSRKGGLPPNLQGMWNVHQDPPWRCGYWHNVNLQMNYWLAFPGNLPELFDPYIDYAKAYLPKQREFADQFVQQYNPSQLDPQGQNGWALGNSNWPYQPSGSTSHSGWGTGPWTTMMFWDYYDYTRDKNLLRDVLYPFIYEQSLYLSKMMRTPDRAWLDTILEDADKLLIYPSMSPENAENRRSWGTTFDQQTTYENHRNTLWAAEILGYKSPQLDRIREQMPKLDPIVIGKSGQIKEYRDEKYYGEYGQISHRHISQLLGAYPGQLINASTPAWRDATHKTLKLRLDYPSTEKGWAKAERIATYARTQDGEMAYGYLQDFIRKCVLHNLWNAHDGNVTADYVPERKNIKLQIDGSFGVTSGVLEMLLQSSEYVLEPLPAIPERWINGRFRGILARGAFEVSAEWTDSHVDQLTILSKAGGLCEIRYPELSNAVVRTIGGQPIGFKIVNRDQIRFESVVGETYMITDIPKVAKVKDAANLIVRETNVNSVSLTWDASPDAVSYNIYYAIGSDPAYTRATTTTTTNATVATPSFAPAGQATFRVTAVGTNGRESHGITTVLNSL